MAALTTGSVLVGRYRLGEPLGSGGSATVFAARDERLQRDVAVKVWNGPGRTDSTSDDETRVLSALNHPGVVVVHDAGTQDGEEFLVMERVEGAPLSALLHDGPLPPARTAALVAQVARTLDHLHAQGLVHGDVKPSNVLVTPDDRVKLADFGGVRRRGEPAEVGTPGFLSPEHRSGEPLTAASDVFSLGLLLRACLEGVLEPPSYLVRLVADATAADPQLRPSAAAVADRLGAPDEPQTLVLRTATGAGVAGATRHSRLWPAAAAVLVAVLALALTAPHRSGADRTDGPASRPTPTASLPAPPPPTVSPTPVKPPAQVVQAPTRTTRHKKHGHGKH